MRVEIVGIASLVWEIQYLTAPPGRNETFKSRPKPVTSGRVEDLVEIPPWLIKFSLEQRVINRLRLNGKCVSVSSEPFNITCYQVHRASDEARKARDAGRCLVHVPSQYQGQLWVSQAPA